MATQTLLSPKRAQQGGYLCNRRPFGRAIYSGARFCFSNVYDVRSNNNFLLIFMGYEGNSSSFQLTGLFTRERVVFEFGKRRLSIFH